MMGIYTFEEITKRWKRGELTSEQAIGQLLQYVEQINSRLGKVEKKVFVRSAAKTSGRGHK